MAPQQHQHPNVPTSKCLTNTSLQTKFYSCKICPKVSPKINSWPYFLSCVIFQYSHPYTDIFSQISKSARSPSYSYKEGYCIRGVYRRGECGCCERCSTQLQTGRRKQDQGIISRLSVVLDVGFLTPWKSTDNVCQEVILLLFGSQCNVTRDVMC